MAMVNLLDWRIAARTEEKQRKKHAIIILLFLLTLTAILHLSLSHKLNTLKQKENSLHQKIIELSTKTKLQNKFAEDRAGQNTSNYIDFVSVNSGNFELLKNISKNLHAKASLSFLERNFNDVLVSGNADDISDIVTLTKKLSATKLFSKVETLEIKNDGGVKKFSLKIGLSRS